MIMNENEYIAGICNIGPEEIARRRTLGWTALVITFLLLFILIVAGVNRMWRLCIMIPAMISATGFLQAHYRFCVGYARIGVFNFGPIGTTQKISNGISKAKDKKRSFQIMLYAALLGIAAAFLSIIVD